MRSIFLSCCVLFCVAAKAQRLAASDFAYLQKLEEDSIKPVSRQMIFDTIPGRRFTADSIFIKLFVKALKVKGSFNYPFDSITTVSKIYPEDSSFRVFTWELERDEGYYRQQGAIQMKTKDGSLKLYPLIDQSDFSDNLTGTARGPQNWVGAIYYSIVTTEFRGKKYYTLLGFDDNDFASTRKWADVLTFSSDGKPVFGADIFEYKADSLKPPQPAYRFLLEFKKDARAKLVYDPDMGMIVFDHLMSETHEQSKKYTLIPDGDYEGFKWKDGKWVHIDDIFSSQQTDDKVPTPKPVYNDAGQPVNQR
ncbi:MAG TPA: hypothetical protein VG738_14735 [Chitinophagaceae bacterium]|nr:hypothetical protein [Chitinophagaceae bacterium]